jgi:hypothetical protein
MASSFSHMGSGMRDAWVSPAINMAYSRAFSTMLTEGQKEFGDLTALKRDVAQNMGLKYVPFGSSDPDSEFALSRQKKTTWTVGTISIAVAVAAVVALIVVVATRKKQSFRGL